MVSEKKKKIAIFIDSRKESGGAYQELIYTLRNIKKFNKNQIEFIVISTSKKLNLNLEKENFELHYFSLSPFHRYVAYLRNFNTFIRGIKKYFFLSNKFENFLRNQNVDLVYFVGPSQYSLYLEDTKFFITIPDVSHRENLEFPEIVNSLEYQRKNDIFQKSLPRALAVITNCKIIKERISNFYGVLKERIFIINHQPSSVISEFKKIDENKQDEFRKKLKLSKNYIFYPAMYLPHKNHRTLIDALKILKKEKNDNLKIVFCGSDIGYLSNLKKYVKSQDLENKIIFLDFVDNDYLPYLYLDSSMLVMPSLIGPTNIPPWEAFKMNKPVIYSDLPGIKDVLGDAVLYIDPMNPIEIANGIEKILNDENFKQSLILKGINKLQENNPETDFVQFYKIIENYRNVQSTWIF
jgi:glycosyltransferase involved in cell wall biosynthesis